MIISTSFSFKKAETKDKKIMVLSITTTWWYQPVHLTLAQPIKVEDPQQTLQKALLLIYNPDLPQIPMQAISCKVGGLLLVHWLEQMALCKIQITRLYRNSRMNVRVVLKLKTQIITKAIIICSIIRRIYRWIKTKIRISCISILISCIKRMKI